MIVSHVHVKNYRSILDERMTFNALTALVGENGAGKSSLLNALGLFFDTEPGVDEDDYHNGNASDPIEITITFEGLSPTQIKLFGSYIEDDSLEVSRTFERDLNGKTTSRLYGFRRQHPRFGAIRRAGIASQITAAYKELQKEPKYAELPNANSGSKVRETLEEWEVGHPEECERLQADDNFFGLGQANMGNLARHVQFILVPAVRDASQDVSEGRSSVVTELVNRVVRVVLEGRQELEDLQNETRKRFQDFMEGETRNELARLGTELSESLRTYAPDVGIQLNWAPLADVVAPTPRAQVKVIEENLESDVGRVGHGVQRALIVALLQQLESVKSRQYSLTDSSSEDDSSHDDEANDQPTLLLAIEEPELYQHPSRQRHIARVLRGLADAESTPGFARTQVIYSTHSPLFVGLDRFDDVRVVSRVQRSAGRPKVSTIRSATLSEIAESLQSYQTHAPQSFTAESLRARLESILNPYMGEIFFARLAVLVEGETDRAALLELARQIGYDFDALGIAVVPCDGKNNIDRPYLILRHLEIGVYVIWDGDSGARNAKAEDNRYMLRVLRQPEEEWPDAIEDTFACFKTDLETTMKDDVGHELFDEVRAAANQQFGISNAQGTKSPAVYRAIVRSLKERGTAVSSLEKIVTNISQLGQNVG